MRKAECFGGVQLKENRTSFPMPHSFTLSNIKNCIKIDVHPPQKAPYVQTTSCILGSSPYILMIWVHERSAFSLSWLTFENTTSLEKQVLLLRFKYEFLWKSHFLFVYIKAYGNEWKRIPRTGRYLEEFGKSLERVLKSFSQGRIPLAGCSIPKLFRSRLIISVPLTPSLVLRGL